MTQEDKDLLLQYLCMALPYGVICFAPDCEYGDIGKLWCIEPFEDSDPPITVQYPKGNTITKFCSEVKPYLRPMSSMTEEEEIEYDATFATIKLADGHYDSTMTYKSFDFLNAHHFDYRGLIEKSLAIVAPDNMYKTE